MKEVVATMAGTVFQVLVTRGEQVNAGQTVIILESMKMEIPIDAAETGKVLDVRVEAGDFVNEGDSLIIME